MWSVCTKCGTYSYIEPFTPIEGNEQLTRCKDCGGIKCSRCESGNLLLMDEWTLIPVIRLLDKGYDITQCLEPDVLSHPDGIMNCLICFKKEDMPDTIPTGWKRYGDNGLDGIYFRYPKSAALTDTDDVECLAKRWKIMTEKMAHLMAWIDSLESLYEDDEIE